MNNEEETVIVDVRRGISKDTEKAKKEKNSTRVYERME